MMTSMKNKRLSQNDRDVLYRFAKKQIAATQDSAELDAAYEAAADAIHAAVVEKFPPKEMAVLVKYEAARPDACVYVTSPDNIFNYDRFSFRAGDKRITARPRQNCRGMPIALEGERAAAYANFKAVSDAYDKQVTQRLGDFRSIIFGSGTFNALADIWPAAEALRGEIVGSSAALSTMSEEVIARLKADPALVPA